MACCNIGGAAAFFISGWMQRLRPPEFGGLFLGHDPPWPTDVRYWGKAVAQSEIRRRLLGQRLHHMRCSNRCPLSGVKRTSCTDAPMSANDPKRTLAAQGVLLAQRGDGWEPYEIQTINSTDRGNRTALVITVSCAYVFARGRHIRHRSRVRVRMLRQATSEQSA